MNNNGKGFDLGPVEATWLKPKPKLPQPSGIGGCPSCRAARANKVTGSNRVARFACKECDPPPKPPRPRPSVGAPPITGLSRVTMGGRDWHPSERP